MDQEEKNNMEYFQKRISLWIEPFINFFRSLFLWFFTGDHVAKIPFFWAIMLPALGLIGWSSYEIYPAEGVFFDRSPEGFSKTLKIFDFPIKVFVGTIPIIALVISIHRSAQTANQIKIAQSKNSFDIHYDHREKLSKLIATFSKFGLNQDQLSGIDIVKVHKAFFPDSWEADFLVSEHGYHIVVRPIKKISDTLLYTERNKTPEQKFEKVKDQIIDLYSELRFFGYDFGLLVFEPKEKLRENLSQTLNELSMVISMIREITDLYNPVDENAETLKFGCSEILKLIEVIAECNDQAPSG